MLSHGAKGLLLAAVYTGLIASVIMSPDGMRTLDPLAMLGAQYLLSILLIPNILSFLITAIVLRRRWVRLNAAQILVVACLSAGATLVIGYAFIVLLTPIAGHPTWYRSVLRVICVVPGIIAGQLLRFGRRHGARLFA